MAGAAFALPCSLSLLPQILSVVLSMTCMLSAHPKGQPPTHLQQLRCRELEVGSCRLLLLAPCRPSAQSQPAALLWAALLSQHSSTPCSTTAASAQLKERGLQRRGQQRLCRSVRRPCCRGRLRACRTRRAAEAAGLLLCYGGELGHQVPAIRTQGIQQPQLGAGAHESGVGGSQEGRRFAGHSLRGDQQQAKQGTWRQLIKQWHVGGSAGGA